MRLDRFDLNLLVALDALLEERSVTRASERLHIGQSATSSALARLREYFDDELLVTTGRQMTLTPLGRKLIEPVRDTLLRARATLSQRAGFDPAQTERRFMIMASDYAVQVVIGTAAGRIAIRAPGVELDIRDIGHQALHRVERGGVDLLVMPAPYVEGRPLASTPLFKDSQVCVAWSGNDQIGDSLTFDQYLSCGHVAARMDERDISYDDWFLPAPARQRRIEATTEHMGSLPFLLLGTSRLATMYRRHAEYFARHLPLRLLDVPFPTSPMVEVMTWPRHLDDDPAHRWLREELLTAARALPPPGLSTGP